MIYIKFEKGQGLGNQLYYMLRQFQFQKIKMPSTYN